jgi:ADP-heptose:LPS heptosyltransferase
LPKVEHYLEFLVYLGINPLHELDFGLGGLDLGQELPHVEPLLSDPAVAVVLGSSWESKEWPFEHYLELVSALVHDRGVQVVLVDAPAKEAMARAITERVGEDKVVNLVGRTTLPQMAAVLKSVHAVIGPDCGAGHVAAAVKTPYISLFGPTSPVRTAPYGNERFVLQADMPCIPCYKRSCPHGMSECMARILPSNVLELLDSRDPQRKSSVKIDPEHGGYPM